MFIDGACAERGPDVVADKFFAQIFDVGGRGAGGERFFAGGFEIFLLAYVADHGDDFALIVFFQPRNDDGGVETSGIGENYFFWFW